jgi:DNA-directed RNA polymerase subunit RPC12/RpoP
MSIKVYFTKYARWGRLPGMAEIMIKVPGYRCERCGHEWVARASRNAPPDKKGETSRPRLCPSCKSAWWDVPPKGAAAEAPKVQHHRAKVK